MFKASSAMFTARYFTVLPLLSLSLTITGCVRESPSSDDATNTDSLTSESSEAATVGELGTTSSSSTESQQSGGAENTEGESSEKEKGPSDKGESSPSDSSEQGETGSTSTQEEQETSSGPKDSGTTEEPECKENELDKNCHALPNGAPIEFPKGVPIGNCKAGERQCIAGEWGKCEGAVAPKERDNCDVPGDDSDCDGIPNTGCSCISGEKRVCGESSVGECKKGEQSCIDGKWDDECVGAVVPSPEKCDGKQLDEDCDGAADIADSDCDCIDGKVEYCERGAQTGDCKWGRRTCQQGKWSACQEWARPIAEICGERPSVEGVKWTGDEDCDGGVDKSPFGKPGPKGCTRMMMDKDGDGWGRLGRDLSEMREGDDLEQLATACLCRSRPDINAKYAEGWTPAISGRDKKDCGDCPGTGQNVYFNATGGPYTEPNRCLQQVGWHGGAFDYDCSGAGEPIASQRTVGQCVKDGNQCVDKPGYWLRSVPACGKQGHKYTWCQSDIPADESPYCEPMVSMEPEILGCR